MICWYCLPWAGLLDPLGLAAPGVGGGIRVVCYWCHLEVGMGGCTPARCPVYPLPLQTGESSVGFLCCSKSLRVQRMQCTPQTQIPQLNLL